ncbi:hypothetical protein PV05_06668 [Exophiala xenobiotica]|uniref:Putative phospholipase n=1 Tax=Exophiala xenobiotica TaxID=348802 RepID=A0A0D2BP01_9EURO|nr:uncharacterized protein PV05_06668 [Exophiala xenobiotica]KIW54301.1 hypothetical protein PV05_06668 [Exophiala xenobiotica]
MLSCLNPLPSLPAYTGPYAVGSTEYEIPLSSLSLPALPEHISLSTIKFRLFYPTTGPDSNSYGIPWLQQPQTAYLNSYLRLAGIKPFLSTILLSVPFYLRTTQIPAYANAPMSYDGAKLPVLIFSHGLVGNMNTHSAILGDLASHGVFCLAIEHRDGSGPLSMVRSAKASGAGADEAAPTEVTSVSFKQISLKIKPGVYEQRDEQLRTRLFEMMAAYRAVEMLNEGGPFGNLASEAGRDGSAFAMPKGVLDMTPGSVIWAGHSFGGTTIVQFVKAVYYCGERQDATCLLWHDPSPGLKAQITPSSPVVLLDPWFLPLKSPKTEALLGMPMPCHHSSTGEKSRTVAVCCSEFAYHWPQCHSYMPAIVAEDPTSVRIQTDEEYREEFAKYRSPREFMNKSKEARAMSKAEIEVSQKVTARQEGSKVSMYVLHDTTHITHCDFGVMFPWLTYWFTEQKRPVLATRNVVRCIMAAAGLVEVDDAAEVAGSGGNGQVQLERVQ